MILSASTVCTRWASSARAISLLLLLAQDPYVWLIHQSYTSASLHLVIASQDS